MPNVQMPNGDVVGFPDDMPSEQIKGMIASKFPTAGGQSSQSQYFHNLGQDEEMSKFPNVQETGGILPVKTTYNPDKTVDSSRLDWSLPLKNMATGVGDLYQQAENKSTDTTPAAVGAMANLSTLPGVARGIEAGVGVLGKTAGALTDNEGVQATKNFLLNNQGEAFQPTRGMADVTSANNKLADNTNALYKKANDLGFSFTPEGGQWLANFVKGNVEDATGGLDKQNHPGVIAALKTLDDKANSENGLDLTGFDKVRQTLGRISQNNNPDKANEVYAANKARQAMDNAIGQAQGDPNLAMGHPDAVDALNAARAAHSLEMQHADIRSIIRNADGNGNKIQSQFQKIFENEDEFDQLLPANQKIIQAIAQPGAAMNAAQSIGNLGLGAGGNKFAVGTEGLAALLHPAAAAVVTPAVAAGTVSNIVRNRLIRQGADQALRNLEDASETIYPLYGQPKFSPVGQKALPAPPLVPSEEPHSVPSEDNPYVDDESGRPMYKSQPPRAITPTQPVAFGMSVPDRFVKNPASSASISPADTLTKNAPTEKDLGDLLNFQNPKYARGGAVNTDPTEMQKLAGNYKKGHIKLHGLDITIENPKGSMRRGKSSDGKQWEAKLPADYGYIKGAPGIDGDHMDCYIGPNTKSNRVYVIHQKHLGTNKLDEHKCMIGFLDRDQAVKTYRDSFSDGKGKQRILRVERMSVSEFKNWLKDQ